MRDWMKGRKISYNAQRCFKIKLYNNVMLQGYTRYYVQSITYWYTVYWVSVVVIRKNLTLRQYLMFFLLSWSVK